ncbi:hypothetical protein T484DRAFT_1758299 [Baffinella frigidus]|nr:hypothetical protein T484DRAFT_1758299 [Cryptophyta sp. CCMP2293]
MPRKITLSVAAAENEMAQLSTLIETCKCVVTKNRFTARRSRLTRHVHSHTNANKAFKQSLMIVHLRSQVHILRAMLMEAGVNVRNMDKATATTATGVDCLGVKQEWLDDTWVEEEEQDRTDPVISSIVVDTTQSSAGGGMYEDEDFLDDLIGHADDRDSNDIESVMAADREYQLDMLDGTL